MFHQLEHNIHHREKTFSPLCYNNLSTMFQECINYFAAKIHLIDEMGIPH